MSGSSMSLMERASVFGCWLDGAEAKLDITSRGLAVVTSQKDRAVFTPSVAVSVMTEKGGKFFTRGNMPERGWNATVADFKRRMGL